MANKLKDLSVTSVDLVDQGANPDAHIRLFKRGGETADPDIGLFEKFLKWFRKGYAAATQEEDVDGGESPETEEVEKEAQTFTENLTREQMHYVTEEMFDCSYALSDSFASILCDDTLTTEAKQSLMAKSLDEFTETVKAALPEWAAGKRMETNDKTAGIQKSRDQQQALDKLLKSYDLGGEVAETKETNEKEVTDTMNIDKSKMTPEERATLETLEKKYGVAKSEDGTAGAPVAEAPAAEPTPAPAETPATPETPAAEEPASADLHPEVAKALADFQELTKRQNAEMEELKKSLEIERLTSVAKKYEVLGKKPEELAKKLYDMKKAGGSVYDEYIALLDESVSTVEKSGLFGEIGSNNQGSAGAEAALGMKAAELAKSATDGMASPDAIVKAWEENPELAAEYEKKYTGR